jgi:hypothetical protein
MLSHMLSHMCTVCLALSDFTDGGFSGTDIVNLHHKIHLYVQQARPVLHTGVLSIDQSMWICMHHPINLPGRQRRGQVRYVTSEELRSTVTTPLMMSL